MSFIFLKSPSDGGSRSRSDAADSTPRTATMGAASMPLRSSRAANTMAVSASIHSPRRAFDDRCADVDGEGELERGDEAALSRMRAAGPGLQVSMLGASSKSSRTGLEPTVEQQEEEHDEEEHEPDGGVGHMAVCAALMGFDRWVLLARPDAQRLDHDVAHLAPQVERRDGVLEVICISGRTLRVGPFSPVRSTPWYSTSPLVRLGQLHERPPGGGLATPDSPTGRGFALPHVDADIGGRVDLEPRLADRELDDEVLGAQQGLA
jgi:hypothetical protein